MFTTKDSSPSRAQIIIHLQDGLVSQVYATIPVEYLVVDEDEGSQKPLVVDRPRNGKNIDEFAQTTIFDETLRIVTDMQ